VPFLLVDFQDGERQEVCERPHQTGF
jgi:hypothetical protein